MPADHVRYPLWQLPSTWPRSARSSSPLPRLWHGNPRAPRYGVAAGLVMAVMTMVCPLSGHTPTGWWTWVQQALSLFVLLTSAALPRLGLPQGRRPPR